MDRLVLGNFYVSRRPNEIGARAQTPLGVAAE